MALVKSMAQPGWPNQDGHLKYILDLGFGKTSFMVMFFSDFIPIPKQEEEKSMFV